MRITPLHHLLAVGAVSAVGSACAPAAKPTRIPPAPIVFRWPDPAFLPERQCHGTLAAEDIAYYLPRARLALDLPSTVAVKAAPDQRCIDIVVESVGAGRLAELVVRGAAVPRRAVLLTLASAEHQH
jgi:hypothetical protein